MPPSASGIADYSAALGAALARLTKLTVIPDADARFDPAAFDLVLYQIGNNPCHSFVYQRALEQAGVIVLHEPNLHHLVADLTIRRGDWGAYLDEVCFDGGERALAHARRVRALEAAPDYAGLPMIRRLLGHARAVVVHSRFAEDRVREAGFHGPLARIPHGAWLPRVDRTAYRRRLGLDETTPLAGIFGHLKPYKRIAESLGSFRRLVRVEPRVKMILAGEPHPDLALMPLVRSLDLSENVRVLGYLPIEDLNGYMAACDVVLNLRYPTVGESSGSLLRAMGLGKAVLVSDVGAFSEYPDDICLKIPVDDSEQDILFEGLNLLVSRPSLAREMGSRALEWVRKECTWELVARRYVAFLESVAEGGDGKGAEEPPAIQPPSPLREASSPRDVLAWAPSEAEARSYVDTHLTRLEKTLGIIPPGGPADRILEMGVYLQITPSLQKRLGYREVRGCYYGPAGTVERKAVTSADGESFECDIDLFDAGKDPFPYPDSHFSTVLCCELIEHLAHDPMHMMAEVNRILRTGGHLVLTTPNLASLRSLSALLQGYHPALLSVYPRPAEGQPGEARHHREYTPLEIHLLLEDAGFEVTLLETGPFREAPRPELAWVTHLLERYMLAADLRGDGIYAVGRKTGPLRQRYPSWLYSSPES
jgi:glycosyltransferase involved in cell wall biosynthesis/SAM-dependent methyltransferase